MSQCYEQSVQLPRWNLKALSNPACSSMQGTVMRCVSRNAGLATNIIYCAVGGARKSIYRTCIPGNESHRCDIGCCGMAFAIHSAMRLLGAFRTRICTCSKPLTLCSPVQFLNQRTKFFAS